MKITRLEILKVPPSWVWLKVHTDEGLVGLGEPFLENHPEAVIAEVRRLEPILLGKDPTRVEDLWRSMYENVFYYKGGPITMSAISGIDIALWDLTGKAAGVPIYQMLGGACRDSVQMYIGSYWESAEFVEPGNSYGHGVTRPQGLLSTDPQVWVDAARGWLDFGFRALKLHFPLGPTLDALRFVDHVPQIVSAVQDAAGVNTPVAVDLHHPHPKVGQQILESLVPYRPLFVEDVQQIERIGVLAELARSTSLPLAAGQSWMGKWDFLDALNAGLSVAQPDLLHAGGITESKKIAAIAEATYASVAFHTPNSIINIAASIQLSACLPNFLIQEHNQVNDSRDDGRTVMGKGYIKNPLVLEESGCVSVPSGPGLGIELDEDGLAEIMAKPWRTVRA